MSSVLTINGVVIDRSAAKVVINRLILSLDQPDTLEFTEKCAALPGAFGAGSLVTLTVDGRLRFNGQIAGSYPCNIGRGGIDVGYRALGLNWLANLIWVTGSDGGGVIVYNLPQSDPDYIPINSGLSVGAILVRLFNLHYPQLVAAGINSFSASELAQLTAVPPEPVVVTGRLWNSVQELLQQWCNKWLVWITPDGVIHCDSALLLPRTTITLDGEPVTLDQISRDHSECYTQVICRGADLVEGAYLSLADATLVASWTAADQTAWSLANFYQPKGAADLGAITGLTSTTVTVKSDDATATWGVNYLSGINGEIWCYDPLAVGLTFSEQRRITANTALAAGGTATITVDSAFNSTGYTRYSLRGQYATPGLVWRKYTIAPTYIAQHIVNHFSHSFPWSTTSGVITQTFTPQALICYTAGCTKPYTEVPALFDVVPYDGVTNGYIVFYEPVVKAFGTLANLNLGGASTDGIPCDIKVLVPYSRGAVSATAPAAGYDGTAFTVDGIQRTLYRDFPQWLDYKDTAGYHIIAQEVLDTVKNTVVEGRLTHYTKYTDFLEIGRAIDIAGVGYITGYEDINAVVRTVVLDYCPDGGPVPWVTQLAFSSRLRPFAGDRLYAHPAYGSTQALGGGFGALASLAPTYQQWQAKAAANTMGIIGPDQTEGQAGDLDMGIGANNFKRRKGKSVDPNFTSMHDEEDAGQARDAINAAAADKAQKKRERVEEREEKRKRGSVGREDLAIDDHLDRLNDAN